MLISIFEIIIRVILFIAILGIWGESERIRKILSKSKNEDKEQK